MGAVVCEPIYSSTALATRQREVKNDAAKSVVHITENGNGAFIFCSEEVFARRIQEAKEEARYELEMEYLLFRAQQDFDEGRYSEDVEDFCNRMRAARYGND